MGVEESKRLADCIRMKRGTQKQKRVETKNVFVDDDRKWQI